MPLMGSSTLSTPMSPQQPVTAPLASVPPWPQISFLASPPIRRPVVVVARTSPILTK